MPLVIFISIFTFRFIDWTHEVLPSSKDDVMGHFQLLGVVEALAALFKVLLSHQFDVLVNKFLTHSVLVHTWSLSLSLDYHDKVTVYLYDLFF